VGVTVGVSVGVAVGVTVGVSVTVGVAVGVSVGVIVGASVAVGVSVGVTDGGGQIQGYQYKSLLPPLWIGLPLQSRMFKPKCNSTIVSSGRIPGHHPVIVKVVDPVIGTVE